MIENNFLYFAALISTLAVALLIFMIYLNYKAKKDNTGDNKRFIQVIALCSIFEIILIIVSLSIISNVIINVYSYLFLVIFALVVASEITYIISIRKKKN